MWPLPGRYAAISHGLADERRQQEQARRERLRRPRGLPVKYVWQERRAEALLPFEELRAYASIMELVRSLAKRGNARLALSDIQASAGRCASGAGGRCVAEAPIELLRPSLMRIDYKVSDARTGVMRRMQLTPQSTLAELKHAESLLVTRHGD